VSSAATSSGPEATLDVVEAVVGSWCARTDPALLSGAQAAGGVARLATVIRQLTAAQVGLAGRVEDCHAHDHQAGTAVDWLARQNGTTSHDAKKVMDTARRLKQCPKTAAAFADGALSLGEVDAISGAAVLDPTAEDALVAVASRHHNLTDTRERTEKVKRSARNGEDLAVRRERLRQKRRWSEFADDEMAAVSARFVPEEWAAVLAVIVAFADAQFQAARRAGTRDPIEAYRADAVLAAFAAAGESVGVTPTARSTESTETAVDDPQAESPGTATFGQADDGPDPVSETQRPVAVRPGRVTWNVTVLVDAIALQRGYATATETCEIPGLGPVDVDWVNRILPDAVVDVLVHDLIDIRAHATLTRHRKKALDTALRARDRRCVVPGCRRRRRLQADHRHDFAKGGETSSANLGLLCELHHADKTYRGARIKRTDTQWLWYPPPAAPGQPELPPGSIPWRAPIGEHLTPFDLTDLPVPSTLIESCPESESDDLLLFR